MKSALLLALNTLRDAGEAAVVATDLESGTQSLVQPLAADVEVDDPNLFAAAGAALAQDRSGVWEEGDRRFFLHVFNPPVRVIVVGAVHIAQSLARMVAEAGFDVSVVDPREAFATPERFPEVDLHCSWPEEALQTIGLGQRSALVTVTHDPKVDDPALHQALSSAAFYIGALGSRRTHTKRLDRLREAGFDDDALARIHAPVGLDIGARSPGEIAASVLAQIIQVLRVGGDA